jgi:hypothetical protein
LQVVDDDDHGPPPRQPGQQPAHGGVNAALVLLRVANQALARVLPTDQPMQHRADVGGQRAGGRQPLI